MAARVSAASVACLLFCGGVLTSGSGWFDEQRARTLAAAAVAVAGVLVAGTVLAAVFWVISGRRVRGGWLLPAALLAATPVDIVAPASDFWSTRVSVVALLDAGFIATGLVSGPLFPYRDATVFPGGEGMSVPQSPLVAFVLLAAVATVVWRLRAPGLRERSVALVFFGVGRGQRRSGIR